VCCLSCGSVEAGKAAAVQPLILMKVKLGTPFVTLSGAARMKSSSDLSVWSKDVKCISSVTPSEHQTKCAKIGFGWKCILEKSLTIAAPSENCRCTTTVEAWKVHAPKGGL
jgi:hypothetical protein